MSAVEHDPALIRLLQEAASVLPDLGHQRLVILEWEARAVEQCANETR